MGHVQEATALGLYARATGPEGRQGHKDQAKRGRSPFALFPIGIVVQRVRPDVRFPLGIAERLTGWHMLSEPTERNLFPARTHSDHAVGRDPSTESPAVQFALRVFRFTVDPEFQSVPVDPELGEGKPIVGEDRDALHGDLFVHIGRHVEIVALPVVHFRSP